MVSDTSEEMELSAGTNITVSLSGADTEQLRGRFAGLAEGGTVQMPLEKHVWGDEFGMLVDRFGVPFVVDRGAQQLTAAARSGPYRSRHPVLSSPPACRRRDGVDQRRRDRRTGPDGEVCGPGQQGDEEQRQPSPPGQPRWPHLLVQQRERPLGHQRPQAWLVEPVPVRRARSTRPVSPDVSPCRRWNPRASSGRNGA